MAKLNPEGTALLYSTYLGGSGEEQANSIAIDDNGDAYVTGATSSADFPGPSGIASKLGSGPRGGGGNDAFVAKLNPSGTALLYSVYLGGTGDDVGRSIAVDGGESAYVMGYTSSTDFPGPSGIAPKLGPGQGGANGDVFVAKLDPAGAALVYSTYLGGSGTNDGNSIAIDSTGDAFVTGWTQSADFPGASGTAPRFGPGSFQDAFVVKLNAAGNALLYGVYLGGSALDVGTGIAVDSSGDAYVVGFTESPDFPGASGIAPKLGSGADGAATDAFVAKLNPTGTSLLYGSYLGGSAYDVGYGIAVDGSGHAFVTGYTDSPDFPGVSGTAAKLGPGAPGGTAPNTGTGDAFVAELNTTGAGLLYSTYLGGSLGDAGIGIALDSDGGGSIYVTGYTISTDFPTQNALQGTFGGGGQDAFVAKIGPDTTPPSCALTGVITGPPKQIQITVQDSDGGLAAPPNGIVVSSTANAIVSIPSYSAGATNQVVVTATKVDQSESAQVGLRVTDLAGNVTNCDPVMTDLIRDSSKPSAITATGIAQSEHLLHIYNGDPGLNHLIIKVNGVKVQERDLEPNEQRTVDISAALHPGNNNRVVVIARGRQRGEATLVIADS